MYVYEFHVAAVADIVPCLKYTKTRSFPNAFWWLRD